MRVLSVRFKSSVGLDDLAGPFRELAPQAARVDGLFSKTWIGEGDMVGGFYIFRDQASLDAFLNGPIVAAVVSNSAFSDFRLEQYDVLEEFSAVTRGLPVVRA